MKTIYLKVEVPDTIPDPDLMVSARVKDTFDEWEELNFEEINMQTEGKNKSCRGCKYNVDTVLCSHPTPCRTDWENYNAG